MNNTATNIVIREAVIRALSEENIKNRQAEFVISTESVDTYDTVFKIDGWDLQRYANNPIVAYGHRTWSDNPDMIIGTSTVRVEGKELIGVVTFEEEEVNPMAEKVWRKVQAGTLRMASVGANPIEYRWGVAADGENPGVLYFTRTELYEWSIVPIGSNPDALKRSVDTIEEIRKSLEPTAPVVAREDKGLSLFEAQSLINNNLI
jgi:HK97 family phage prohead protease